eukprot:4518618-Amphidinium_carterae.1
MSVALRKLGAEMTTVGLEVKGKKCRALRSDGAEFEEFLIQQQSIPSTTMADLLGGNVFWGQDEYVHSESRHTVRAEVAKLRLSRVDRLPVN